MAKIKYKRKTWWQKHWDETLFAFGIALAIYFILKGAGYFV